MVNAILTANSYFETLQLIVFKYLYLNSLYQLLININLTLQIVRSQEDMETKQISFHPNFTHQIFKNEKIETIFQTLMLKI